MLESLLSCGVREDWIFQLHPAASTMSGCLNREERLFHPLVHVIFCLWVTFWGPWQPEVCDLAVVFLCDLLWS